MDFLPIPSKNLTAPDAATSLLPVTIIQAGQDKSQEHLEIYGRLVLLNPFPSQSYYLTLNYWNTLRNYLDFFSKDCNFY